MVRKLHLREGNTDHPDPREIILRTLCICVSIRQRCIFKSPSHLLTILFFFYRPEGTYAVITKHGKFDHVKKEGGLVFCLPWTKIQFLVTKQDIIYKFPVRACPTYDNIFVALDIAVVFRCKENDDDIRNFVYRISIN